MLSPVRLFATLWTVAHHAPLSTGFFREESSQPRDQTQVSCISRIGRWILYNCATWQAHYTSAAAKSLQSCPTL